MQNFWQIIQRKLELPAELVSKEPKLTFFPKQKRIVIENPGRILVYEYQHIVLEMSTAKIIITGKRLQLNALLPDMLEIYGDLRQVEVADNG